MWRTNSGNSYSRRSIDSETSGNERRRFLSSSLPAQQIARESLIRDLKDTGEDVDEVAVEEDADLEPGHFSRSATNSYRKSFLNETTNYHRAPVNHAYASAFGSSSFLLLNEGISTNELTQSDIQNVHEQERSLLRDNEIIPPKHPWKRRRSLSRPGRRSSGEGSLLSQALRRDSRNQDTQDNEHLEGIQEVATPATERDALIPSFPFHNDNYGASHTGNGTAVERTISPTDLPYGGQDTETNIQAKWEEAVEAGKIQTTWQREAKFLARYSPNLIVTFFLQYSLTVVSVFTVGHLSKEALGAVSLGSMTCNITGNAITQGLATSLDTLCAQAYGSGKKTLVGLQMQRMILFQWMCLIPVAILWWFADKVLAIIIPEKEVAELAGLYLKIAIIGAPAFAAFETGKRFVQAQGLFSANMYVLLVVAPTNAFMHWLLVWKLQFGFVGAPIAYVTTELLMPTGLFLYVYFIDGRECWGGFSKAAFKNWGPMVWLAIPGVMMVVCEYLAFEILTLSASFLGSTQLAAQSITMSFAVLMYQIPFPIAVCSSTRIANLIGATLADAAKTAARVAGVTAIATGTLNCIIILSLRSYIPRLFTSDKEVAQIATDLLPVVAAFQLFDSTAAQCNGILRGIGRQGFGGWMNLLCYYGYAVPVSMVTCFVFHWGLYGLWSGPATALALITVIEGWYIVRANWERSVEEAQKRNTFG